MSKWKTELSARHVGACAWSALKNAASAALLGVTSRGIFVHLTLEDQPAGVLFLSFEQYCSPLTLTLQTPAPPELRSLPQKALVLPMQDRLVFPQIGLAIRTAEPAVWLAPPAPTRIPAAPARRQYLQNLVHRVLALKETPGFAPLLLPLLGEETGGFSDPELALVWPLLQSFLAELKGACTAPAVELASHLLGWGRGLTPAGDDVCVGFLLFLNRFRAHLSLPFKQDELNPLLLNAARKRTTTLSAAMVECAAQGQADERLIAAADYLAAGIGDAGQCAEQLVSMGHSSGVDSLVGMAAAALV